MKCYDIIIIGAGASGLSLAYHLADSPLRDRSILIIDRSLRERADRTWAFWTSPETPTPFDPLAYRTWNRLVVATGQSQWVCGLGTYRYRVIKGADFYRFAHQALSQLPNVELVQGKVEGVVDCNDGALVRMEGQAEHKGRWVFDSRFRLAHFSQAERPHRHYRYLNMQFRGWEIETPSPAFDPGTPTFLDFRTPQRAGDPAGPALSFLYILPYSPERALVEYVVCGSWLIHQHEQQHALKTYISRVLGIEQYRIVDEEQGINPMTDYPFPRRVGRHIMSIGIPGGMLKPTTGFAFTRIQRDSAAIVRSLQDNGHPFDVPVSPPPYRLYESLMLGAMSRYGGQVGSLLATFFRFGSTKHILRFLDERGAPI